MTAPQRIMQASLPEVLPVKVGQIPIELKVRPQWVNWKYVWDGRKWAKHPYDPRSGRRASSTNLLSWNNFEQVVGAYEVNDYDGVGFVFSSGDPYSGVDLDGCRNVETGDIEGWATEIVHSLDSYTELSPSGEGIHIIVKGKLPAPLKRGHIEMYSTERYFTITGHIVELPA